jgi:oligopeptide/dipeptide ABC transporter ATP-binding protein
MIILDTNVLSALMQSPAEPQVVSWLDDQSAESIWITSVTLFEARYGLELLPAGQRKTVLRTIEGQVPSADAWPQGCRFRDRCPLVSSKCSERPVLTPLAQADHQVACWHTDRVAAMA